MHLNVRRASGFILLIAIEMPRRALSYSWSWVSSRGNGIENLVTLSVGKCGSHLYRPQEHEVYLYPTGFEHEAKKMDQVDQRSWGRSALPPEQGKCGCRCTDSLGSLQLLVSCASYWGRVQHLHVTRFVIVQHHPHTHLEEWDHCCIK
jgi:hypothetical protein